MSKCQTSALLGSQETVWKLNLTEQGKLPNMITCRYVDDSITASKTLCHECQHLHLSEMTNVLFEKQQFSPTKVQWLDVTISTQNSNISLQPAEPEPAFLRSLTTTQ
jgi:hypothetical protein